MTNSMYERARGFATVSDYPKGLMNFCPCGQVVLAPALYHEGQPYWANPNKCKELFEGVK